MLSQTRGQNYQTEPFQKAKSHLKLPKHDVEANRNDVGMTGI